MSRLPLHECEDGNIATEYLVILVLVAIASIAAWTSYRQAISEDADEHYQTFGYPPEGS